MIDDRREFQRLKLSKPILAMMDDQNALILDIGMAGAFVEHYGRVDIGHSFRLTFRWQGQDVEFASEIVRTNVVREPGGNGESPVSHSGVHFIRPIGDASARLQDLISTFVMRILAAQKTNATGEGDSESSANVLASLGGARRKRIHGYVSYHLRDGSWWRLPTDSPKQPEDGFTVAAWEDEHELESLCRTYESADEEGRELIRLVAELSAHSAVKPR